MYLPRSLISLLYKNLERTRHSSSPPVLLLVALEPDAICACKILTTLFKRDYIQHNIIPVAGYGDLARAGEKHVQPMRLQNGGSGGTVICLGVGGLVDLGEMFGLDSTDEAQDPTGGVEVWVIDARRPWNLGNVFGGGPLEALVEVNGNARKRQMDVEFGEIKQNYRPGKGGIVVFDDGDIGEELEAEREAYYKLEQMPEIEDDGNESDQTESESDGEASDGGDGSSRKRKSWTDAEDENDEDEPPRQRRRSNSDSLNSSPVRPARRGLVSTGAVVPNSYPTGSESPDLPPPSHQTKPVSTRRNRRRLLRLKRQHEATLHAYYSIGISYSEPISSLLYSLASDLGREDNNALWNAIVGVSSLELYGRTISGTNPPPSELNPYLGWGGDRGERIRQVLRDEVRRLNPPDPKDTKAEAGRGEASGVIPTTANSPTDNSIRLSPEPRFLLIRHWSLYDSMLHSPYLAARLHLWTDMGRKRLNKLLAKMGIGLSQSKQSYTHMDMDLKRVLRQRLLKYAPLYGLDGLVPPPAVNGRGREGWGFVRSWGWKACLSAIDVGVILGAMLEVGKRGLRTAAKSTGNGSLTNELIDSEGRAEGEEYVERFWEAYDALDNVSALTGALTPTLHLQRAILRTGTAILSKNQIRHLRAFRMAVVRDGPDVQLFTHPGALTKLALWVGEAIAEQERERGGKPTPLVLAALNERRGVYVVVGTGGRGLDLGIRDKEREERKKEREQKREEKRKEKEARREEKRAAKAAKKAAKAAEREDDGEEEDEEEEEEEETEEESSGSDSDSEDESGPSKNRFGNSFLEVVDETSARVRIESFDHCVVEVRKDDLGVFLEALSSKSVMG